MKTARSFLTSLSTLVLLSLVLGLVAGAAAQKWGLPGGHATADFIQALGQLWLNALRMTIIPLVFSLLVTGIASPAPLQKEVESYTPHVKLLAFDDHHDFTPKDLLQIKEQFQHLEEWKRLIITTEKDAARLKLHPALDETLKPYIYVLPIEIEILQNQQYIFNQNIIGYVRAHSRNSSLSEGKDAHPT